MSTNGKKYVRDFGSRILPTWADKKDADVLSHFVSSEVPRKQTYQNIILSEISQQASTQAWLLIAWVGLGANTPFCRTQPSNKMPNHRR